MRRTDAHPGRLAMVLLAITAIAMTATAATAQGPAGEARTTSELETLVAIELSRARMNPSGMAADLRAPATDHPYRGETPDGAEYSGQQLQIDNAATRADQQQPLTGYKWSTTLAEAARAHAGTYAMRPGVAHGTCRGKPLRGDCMSARLDTAKARNNTTVGNAIEAAASSRGLPGYGKSFAYSWWVAGTHQGIINDSRMDTIGVGCAKNNKRGKLAGEEYVCIAIAAESVSDASATVLGAGGGSLAQLPALTGAVGATTLGGSTALGDLNAPAPEASPDGAENLTRPVGADANGNSVDPISGLPSDQVAGRTGDAEPTTTDGGSPEVGKMYYREQDRAYLFFSAEGLLFCPNGRGSVGPRKPPQFVLDQLEKPQDVANKPAISTACDTDSSGTVIVVTPTKDSVYANRVEGTNTFEYVKLLNEPIGLRTRPHYSVCGSQRQVFDPSIMELMETDRATAAGLTASNETC